MPYPAGPVVRLQNDPNDYFGVSLSSNRRDLVTSRRDARMDVWIGDGGGATGSTVAQHVKVSIPRIAWSGDRLLYGGNVGGKATILGTTAGATTSDAVLSDGLTPAATRDGGTIVFVSPRLDLWTADASGRRLTQLVAGVSAAEVAVTPNDRDVLFTRVGETVSIWTVPLAGGKPARLVDGADAAAISPDGRTLAFVAHGSGEQAALLRVCGLPGCISSRPIGAATSETSISWTPDGSGVAFARDGNLWVQATEGGASRPLTRFTDTRPIGVVRVVARRHAPGDHTNNGHQRHRPLQGVGQRVSRAHPVVRTRRLGRRARSWRGRLTGFGEVPSAPAGELGRARRRLHRSRLFAAA